MMSIKSCPSFNKSLFAGFAALVWLLLPNAVFADSKKVYENKCTACHGFGIAGAPKIGDIDDWRSRIEKGMVVLYKNAIEGFTGDKGVMPPKGGFTEISDDEIKSIVDYMVESSR